MPAARETTRREAARRADQGRTRDAGRERLHAVAWAAHEAGDRPAPRVLARRAGVAVQTMHRHALALKREGRWPWPNVPGPWRNEAGQGRREARARVLLSHPSVPGKVRGAVARACRVCPTLADEFESHAWLALWEAAMKYREDSSVEWPHFLAIRLRNSLVDCRRRWRHTERAAGERAAMVSLDEPVGGECDGDGERLGDMIATGELPVGWEVESEDAVEAILSRVGGKRRETLRAMYLACAEDREAMARRIGVDVTTLFFHHRKAMAEIRGALGVGKGGVA